MRKTITAVVFLGILASSNSVLGQPLERVTWYTPQSNWEKSWLMSFYNKEYVDDHDKNIDWADPPFVMATIRLNDSECCNNPAIFVKWVDGFYCGSGGCRIDVWYEKSGARYEKVGMFLGSFIQVAEAKTNGLYDIWLNNARFRFDGHRYTYD